MPKLAAKDQKKVEKAEATHGGFEPIPAGKYTGALKDVEAKLSTNGNPTWNVEFEDIEDLDGEEMPGRQFLNLTLPGDDKKIPEDYTGNPKSKKSREEQWVARNAFLAGKVKAFFEAFGYTTDSDTDEMIGDRCVLVIGIETVGAGKRKGELTNRVNDTLPLDDDMAASSTGGGDEDEF